MRLYQKWIDSINEDVSAVRHNQEEGAVVCDLSAATTTTASINNNKVVIMRIWRESEGQIKLQMQNGISGRIGWRECASGTWRVALLDSILFPQWFPSPQRHSDTHMSVRQYVRMIAMYENENESICTAGRVCVCVCGSRSQ